MRSLSKICFLPYLLTAIFFSSPAYSKGPFLIADINPAGNSYVKNLIVFNSKLYFSAWDGVHGNELWVYDGVNPPEMIADVNPALDLSPRDLTIFNSKLYFSANTASMDRELWVFDGINPVSVYEHIKIHPGIPVYGLAQMVFRNLCQVRQIADTQVAVKIWPLLFHQRL